MATSQTSIGCASRPGVPVTASNRPASSASRRRSPTIDWCSAACPSVSVTLGAAKVAPAARSSKYGAATRVRGSGAAGGAGAAGRASRRSARRTIASSTMPPSSAAAAPPPEPAAATASVTRVAQRRSSADSCERVVDGLDLRRVDRPLAVVAQLARGTASAETARASRKRERRPVDRQRPADPGRGQQGLLGHEPAGLIALGAPPPERRGKIGVAQDQRDDPRVLGHLRGDGQAREATR